MNFEILVDDLLKHYTAGPFSEDILEAKKRFNERAGVLDEESQDYELKMTQFSDWYIFTRPLENGGIPPVEKAIEDRNFTADSEIIEGLKALAANRHSLFEFIKLSKDDLHIRDIISKYKFVVKKSPVTIGFNKGELFEARLIPFKDNYTFSRAFCFHPPQATKYITKESKKLKKLKDKELKTATEELIMKFFVMKNKFDQYSHLPVEAIYSEKSKI